MKALALVILTILKFVFGYQNSKSVVLTRHLYGKDSGLFCNDGSPGGYYMNENSDSNLWVFYQEGGGWCYDESSCKKRITNNLAIGIVNDLISSKLWPPVQYNMKGIFQTFPDANLVYIPYCSSDAHMTDTERTIDGRTIYFHGRKLAFETVTSLIGQRENQTIIFGGTSAGGRGSMVTIDLLVKLLPPSTKVYGLHDSGNYVDVDPYNPDQDSFMDQCQKAYDLYGRPTVNEQCSNEYKGEEWKCLCGKYMLPMVQTPSQIVFYLYDSYQLHLDIGQGKQPSDWSRDDCLYAKNQFQAAMIETYETLIANTKHVVFSPTCYDHGIMAQDTFQTVNIDGVFAESQLKDYINSGGLTKQNKRSNCNQVNCEESCESIDFGPNTQC